MTILEAWEAIRKWMDLYIGEDPIFLILAVDALIYLLIANKSIRKTIIIPILFMIPVVINPILYKYIYHDLRYWRIFWAFPELILIGLAIVDIARKINNQWTKIICLLATAITIMLAGKYAFAPENRYPASFQPANLPYKVSKTVKENCDIILADNPYPKCIFQDGVCETRQYSGYITQLYGRDVDGYIMGPSEEGAKVYKSWNGTTEEHEYIFQIAEEKGYTHICCHSKKELDEMALKHGYSILATTVDYTIYHRQ